MQKAETGHSRASNTLLGRKSAKKRSDSERPDAEQCSSPHSEGYRRYKY